LEDDNTERKLRFFGVLILSGEIRRNYEEEDKHNTLKSEEEEEEAKGELR